MGGFSKSLGYCNAYVAEIWGVYEGLLLAKRKGYKQLVVELAAEFIVKLLRQNKLGRCEGWSLMRRIRDLLHEPGWCLQFLHTYKEAKYYIYLKNTYSHNKKE